MLWDGLAGAWLSKKAEVYSGMFKLAVTLLLVRKSFNRRNKAEEAEAKAKAQASG